MHITGALDGAPRMLHANFKKLLKSPAVLHILHVDVQWWIEDFGFWIDVFMRFRVPQKGGFRTPIPLIRPWILKQPRIEFCLGNIISHVDNPHCMIPN